MARRRQERKVANVIMKSRLLPIILKPRLLPIIERGVRFALHRRGFASRTVSTGLARMHAYDAPGRGFLPTTVVLHGIGSTASSFGPLLTHLRPHVRRVVAPELPAHGFSESPVDRLTASALFDSLRTALNELVREPMTLVGNSLGGALALR